MSAPAGSGDPTSLDRLHDILVPDPAPFWPPAPGWLWLFGMLALVLLAALLRAFVRRQRNRYRHEALQALSRLQQGGDDAGREQLVDGLSTLLKRTALTAYGRDAVAAMTGPDWFAFLDRSGGTHFAEGLGADLERANFQGRASSLDAARVEEMCAAVRYWIRHHKVSATSAETLGSSGDDSSRRLAGQARAA